MRKQAIGKMPRWQRWLTISAFLSCSISGIAFLLSQQSNIIKSILGSHWVLTLHGATASLAIMALGATLPFHIKAGLKAKKNVISGISQIILLVILIITGLLLYYGPEETRNTSVLTHWIVGILFLALFVCHAVIRISRK